MVATVGWWWMQPEDEKNELRPVLGPYQVNEALWSHTKPGAKFMHCLPAIRGEEMTDAILDGPFSIVLDEAENRKHFQKALSAGAHRHRRAAGRPGSPSDSQSAAAAVGPGGRRSRPPKLLVLRQAVQLLEAQDLDELMVAAHADHLPALEAVKGAAERLGHGAETRGKLALACGKLDDAG